MIFINPPGSSEKNRDTTPCPFCSVENLSVILDSNTAFAIKDGTPVSPGHVLILPRRHCSDYFDMTDAERRDAHALIENLRILILSQDPSVKGFNIGVNCGKTAGQTIFHAHIHLIPRRENDTPNPRGGVRGVIPDKMNY